MDFRHPYLTEQLIAYIGNKRALLPFLHQELSRLADGGSGLVFCDPFAGSGAVSRLARLMGFTVLCNDWERYCLAINGCHLGVAAEELPRLFPGRGLAAVLEELNALPPPPAEHAYISRHFAPRDTSAADWRTERLFYTAENAALIDSMRARIEELYPGMPGDERKAREKLVLLGPLLYEAATHTNTSGVFKACHKGFGGHGGDALGRILGRIRLRPPVLADSPFPSRVYCEDGEGFVSAHPAHICYLDPPYAAHQYGSNYFMLTTIAEWDRPPVSSERGPDGRFREKAGIRADWVRTRSAFCSRLTAPAAFRSLARAADCRWLCVSYSDEGILSPEELADILAETGSLSVRATTHVKYPGGRQSNTRTARTVELLLVVDRRSRTGGRARGRAGRALLDARLARLMAGAFHPGRIHRCFSTSGPAIAAPGPETPRVLLPMHDFHRFSPAAEPRGLTLARAQALERGLRDCLVTDRQEEIRVLLDLLRTARREDQEKRWKGEVLRCLRKLAHRKHRHAFEQSMRAVRAFADEGMPDAAFTHGLDRVVSTARARFGGA
jgi:adenine-specific DNA-methyltransferase